MEPEIVDMQQAEVANRENFATPTGKSSKRFSMRSIQKSAGRVFEEVKNAFSPADAAKDGPAPVASPAKGTLTRSESSNLTRKLSIKGLADSLKGSIRRKLASSLQSILDVKPQKIFGMKLEDLLEKEKELGSRDGVPALVTRCIEYLIPAYVKEEGLFRLSGAATDIQKMKETINKGDALEMLADSPHNVAGLLKLFIRELPEPLIPENVQNRYLILPDMDDREMQRAVLYDLISDLPLSHLRLMRVIFSMLGSVRAHSEENKMTASNLATCWAPNIFRSAAQDAAAPTSVDAAQKMIEFSRQSNAVVQFMIEEESHLFKERDFEKIYSIPQASPRPTAEEGTPVSASKSRKRSREEMLAIAPASPRSPAANTRSARRAIRSEMIGSYDQVLEANGVAPAGVPALAIGDILTEQATDDMINSPAPKKRKTSHTSIFASAVTAVKESPRAIGKMVSKRFSERRRTVGPAPTMCLMFYYDDSKHSHAMRKLLSNASLTPCEIRDETRDPMSFAECKNLLPGIDSIVVVKKNGEKAYTETHPVSSKLDDTKLQSLVINPETGKVRAPTIIVGSTLVVGYDKDVEEFFSCYLFYK